MIYDDITERIHIAVLSSSCTIHFLPDYNTVKQMGCCVSAWMYYDTVKETNFTARLCNNHRAENL